MEGSSNGVQCTVQAVETGRTGRNMYTPGCPSMSTLATRPSRAACAHSASEPRTLNTAAMTSRVPGVRLLPGSVQCRRRRSGQYSAPGGETRMGWRYSAGKLMETVMPVGTSSDKAPTKQALGNYRNQHWCVGAYMVQS